MSMLWFWYFWPKRWCHQVEFSLNCKYCTKNSTYSWNLRHKGKIVLVRSCYCFYTSWSLTHFCVLSKLSNTLRLQSEKPIDLIASNYLIPSSKMLCDSHFSALPGLVKDDQTLAGLGLGNGAKMMLVGSKLTDVIEANTLQPKTSSSSGSPEAKPKREPLSKQKPHTKVRLDCTWRRVARSSENHSAHPLVLESQTQTAPRAEWRPQSNPRAASCELLLQWLKKSFLLLIERSLLIRWPSTVNSGE